MSPIRMLAQAIKDSFLSIFLVPNTVFAYSQKKLILLTGWVHLNEYIVGLCEFIILWKDS